MRKNILLFNLMLIGTLLFATSNLYARGASSASVKFGSPEGGNTTKCSGKGICMLTSLEGGSKESIRVDFELLPILGDSRDLVMSFNINDLKATDYDQVRYFVDAAGRPQSNYSMNYVFTDREVCANLGIEPNELQVSDRDANAIEMVSNTIIRVTYRIPAR